MEKCTLEQNGFIGFYYPGTVQTHKAVISVGGAGCDEKASLAMAQYLIDAGYNVLVLGFYMWKGLSKNLASVPVDYCEKAVHWLKEEKGIEKIAMTGISTGGGYTLVCGSLIPEITCLIPVVPFDFVCEGTNTNNKRMGCSVYKFHEKDHPYMEGKFLDKGMFRIFLDAGKAEGYGYSRFMRYIYDKGEEMARGDGTDEDVNQRMEAARIKVENSNADILLLAAKDDDCWPSDIAVPRIVKKLKEVNYPHKVEYKIYEKGSHALLGGMETAGLSAKLMVNMMIPTEKKYPKECEEARQDCMKRAVDFIAKW